MTDPVEIARKLTKAGNVGAVLEFSPAWKFCDPDEVAHTNLLGVTVGRETSFGEYAARLTPLGLAVRAELEKM